VLDPTMRIIRSDFVRAPESFMMPSAAADDDDTTPTPATGLSLSTTVAE